jgi:hypothetical protein
MNCQVVTKAVSAQPLAAVRRRALSRDVGRIWKPALDLVWEFLRRHKACEPTAIIASSTIILSIVMQRWTLTSAFRSFGPLRAKAR